MRLACLPTPPPPPPPAAPQVMIPHLMAAHSKSKSPLLAQSVPGKRKWQGTETNVSSFGSGETSQGRDSDQDEDLFRTNNQKTNFVEVHAWMNQARSTELVDNTMLKDAIELRCGTTVHRRFPFEELHLFDDRGGLQHTLQVHARTDLAWCCMLYGRNKKVMPHLAMALMMGHALRTKVKPELEKLNITFENVLFVTPDSLEEQELQAVSYFWAIKFVDLPQVCKKRLVSLSQHLVDKVEPEHVFLKFEAWRIESKVSIISDLDMLILNEVALAEYLQKFLKSGPMENALQKTGSAVMQRLWSAVDFEQEPQEYHPNRKSTPTPVSYCFAIIKPSIELANQYEAAMAAEPSVQKGSRLSDQDLLGEVLKQGHVLLPHDLVMFPSWFNHTDWLDWQGQKLLATVDANSVEEFQGKLPAFVEKFGAVHFSRVFSMTNILDTEAAFLKQLIGSNKKKSHETVISVGANAVTSEVWAKEFLLPLWRILHERFHAHKCITEKAILAAIGGTPVTGGLAKAFVSLRSVQQRTPPGAV